MLANFTLHRDPSIPLVRQNLWAARKMPSDIYQGHYDGPSACRPVAKKEGGTAIGTIYELGQTHERWLGKVGNPSIYLRDDSSTVKTRTRKQMNLDAIIEKIAADFFAFFQKKYKTPETCLSLQKVLDEFTRENAYACDIAKALAANDQPMTTLRFMSRFVDGYQDLALAKTDLSGATIPIKDYITHCHRPPEKIMSPNGELVPLKGMMELCAAMRVLADTDGLGGDLRNAGFVWEKEGDRVIAARVVKIDPGQAFQFSFIPERACCNWALLTENGEQIRDPSGKIFDSKDIQVANNNETLTFRWKDLTQKQRSQFLDALTRMMGISKEDIFCGFYRNGAFSFEPNATDQISKEEQNLIASLRVKEMSDWIELQRKIYKDELVRSAYPLPLANFVGRKEILKVLAQKLTPTGQGVTAVVLCGFAGMGKSELASYFAYKNKKSFSLIYWLQCDNEETLTNSYLSLAKHLQLSLDDTSSLDAIRKQVHKELEKRQGWLLIFDNAENSFPLPEKGGSILINSQRQDRWPTEGVVEVPPLSLEESKELVRSIFPGVHPLQLEKLVEKFGAIPLAISRAAAVSIKERPWSGYSFSQKYLLSDVWNPIFNKIKRENPEAFNELIIVASFLHDNIPINCFKDQSLDYLEKRHLIHLDRQHGVFSMHKLLQKALCRYRTIEDLGKLSSSQESLLKKVWKLMVIKIKKKNPEAFNELIVASSFHYDNIPIRWFQDGTDCWTGSYKDRYLPYLEKRHLIRLNKRAGVFSMHKLLQEALRPYRNIGHNKKAVDLLLNGHNKKVVDLLLKKSVEKTLSYIHGECYIAQQSIKKDDQHAELLGEMGDFAHSEGKFQEALKWNREALEIWKEIGEETELPHFHVVNALYKIGSDLAALHRFTEALETHHQALNIAEGEPFIYVHAILFLDEVGGSLLKLGRFEEAVKVFQEVLVMKKKIFDEPHDDMAMTLNQLGVCLSQLEHYDKALESFQEALNIRKRVYGKIALVVESFHNVGHSCCALNRFEQALDVYNQALEMAKTIHDNKPHPDIALSFDNLGRSLFGLKRYDDALEAFFEALYMRNKIHEGSVQFDMAESNFYIGRCYEESNNFEKAVYSYKKVLKIVKQAQGAHESFIADTHLCLGRSLCSLKRYEKALDAYEKAVKIIKKIHNGKPCRDIVSVFGQIRDILILVNRPDEAAKFKEKALKMQQELDSKGGSYANPSENWVDRVANKIFGLH
jgi:tetratricopeptide (TPR) repeat protein